MCVRACVCLQSVRVCACVRVNISVCARTQIHTNPHTRTRTHTRTCTHTYANTYTHTHTHTRQHERTNVHNLRSWWDTLSSRGPAFGYHPNASKTYLVVKQEHETSARQLFADTEVHITLQEKRHLGAAIGSKSFTEEYVRNKVETCTNEIKRLARVAVTQRHADFAAFTHGLSSRWSYLTRTIPDIQDLLLPLEKEIHQTFIPAIIGRPPCSELERDLLSLPARIGGMGLTNPATVSQNAFLASQRLTAPLAALIITQETNQAVDPSLTQRLKSTIRSENRQRHDQQALNIYVQLTPQQKRCVDLAKARGSSSWLNGPRTHRTWVLSSQGRVSRCRQLKI